jgi:hypothetical protein
MSEETPTSLSAEERSREREAFNKVADAMEALSEDARVRLFRLLGAHFDLPIGEEHRRTPPRQIAGSATASSFSEDRSISPKQFMIEKRPLTDLERIACLAYYLTHYRDQHHFKTVDLSKLNTEAAQVKLSNPAKSVDNATARGFLSQVGGGKKQLSANGELYVQALPDRDAAKAAVAHAKPRRRPNKPKNEATLE